MGQMIAELCMNTGWTFEYVKSLPMPTFAMFMRHTRKIKEDGFNRLLLELCDVAAIACQSTAYHDALKGHYFERILPEEKRVKRSNPRLFNVENKEQADSAAGILASAFKKKKQLMGLDSGR